jgi:predicted Zn-dependent protease
MATASDGPAPQRSAASAVCSRPYTCPMTGSIFYQLGRIAGVQLRKARWMWGSIAGNEAEGIQAEHAVGRDMAAIVLQQTPRDSDPTAQASLDQIAAKLAAMVRNRLHRFQITVIEADHPTAFALPGGFIFISRSLVELCHRNHDDIAFVLAHEMAHVIRRHGSGRTWRTAHARRQL